MTSDLLSSVNLKNSRDFTQAPLHTRMTALRLARLARQSLIAEAELTPKPGLVDRRGSGAHRDLSPRLEMLF